MSISDKILALTKQLYPTGRAFRMPEGGDLETLHSALLVSEVQAYNDAVAILDSMLPDNANFTTDDATDWERRLGLIYSPLVSLANRKAAILRKLQAPGINPAKGHYLNLERELQLAGFNVYVYENIPAQNPAVVNPAILSQSQHGDHQHGDVQSAYLNNICVNSIYNDVDIAFNIGQNLRATFFIGSSVIGGYANVPANREIEFRQLILKIKQVQTVAILFVTYI